MRLIEELKAEGRSWIYSMITLADKYCVDDSSGNANADHGAACSLYSLVLENMRALRPNRGEMKGVLNNYSVCVYDLVHETLNRGDRNVENYAFIIDKAYRLLEAGGNAIREPDAAGEALERLTTLRKELGLKAEGDAAAPNAPEAVRFFDCPADFQVLMAENLRPLEQNRRSARNAAGPADSDKAKLTTKRIVYFVFALLFVGLSVVSKTNWYYIGTGLYALLFIGTFIKKKQ